MLKHVRGLSIPGNREAASRGFEVLCYRPGTLGERGAMRVYCVWPNGALQGLDSGNYRGFREEGCGCRAAGCYWEGGYAHKPARRAPAPELLLGFHLGHSFTLLVAEQ